MNDEVYIDAKFNWEGRELTVRRGWYQYGNYNQPALLCFDENDPECCLASRCPYGILTVNLDHPATEHEDDDNIFMQFLDVNNWPGIEDILKDATWIESAKVYVPSGFVNYPIYIFTEDIEEVKYV